MKKFVLFVFPLLLVIKANALDLSNPDATTSAMAQTAFLKTLHGKYMLAGQHAGRGHRNGNDDIEYIYDVTGKYPAVLSLDVGIYTKKFSEDYQRRLNNVFLDARDYWNEGGIVTLCWHWGNPMKERNSYNNTKIEFDIKKALKKGTPEHEAMMKDLDVTAGVLKKFQDAEIPILWRPLHEACGGWFWWSKQGRESLINLWRFMFEYYTNEHELNNLIWIYSASNKIRADWFPGHDTVDLVGVDFYNKERMVDPELYQKLESMADGKTIALTENDHIPDPETCLKEDFLWTWFATWHTEWLRKNSKEHLKFIYHHEKVITRDELKDHFVRH